MFAEFVVFFFACGWVFVTLIIVITGLSSAFRSFKNSIREEDNRHPPKLLSYFVSHERRGNGKNSGLKFSYPVRIAHAMYDVLVDVVIMLFIGVLWPIGCILLIIPYICSKVYEFSKDRLPVVHRLQQNDSPNVLESNKKRN